MTLIPRGNQFLHILVPLPILATGSIGVGQFIHQRHRGLAREHRRHIHLPERDPVILHEVRRDDLQILDLGLVSGRSCGST